jgi:UPF0042 nucleotide-binding protein
MTIGIAVVITSFGYRHSDDVPNADLVLDVRGLRDPMDAGMRQLTGLDHAVHAHVMSTANVEPLLASVLAAVERLVAMREPASLLTRVAFGCAGGRHRSVALAEELAKRCALVDIETDVEHRDIDLAVL